MLGKCTYNYSKNFFSKEFWSLNKTLVSPVAITDSLQFQVSGWNEESIIEDNKYNVKCCTFIWYMSKISKGSHSVADSSAFFSTNIND